jgi:PAS domain S-box-containing protein
LASLKASNGNTAIRVLHVDDEPSIQEITKLMLLDLNGGFVIDWACCVDEALKKISTGHYDVVVSDYEMPQKDGLELLKELRDAKNKVPFILFTGKGREEIAIKALNLGADGYYNKQGNPETVYGELAHGILSSFGHKKADELLRKSQAELKAIVFNAPIGIATSDSNMQFKSANEAFCRIVGYSEEELQKRSFRDITYPDDVEVSNKDMQELSCGNISYFSKEKRYVRKDGCKIDGKVTVNAIRDKEGKPVLYVAELEDITRHKQAEAELRETFSVLEQVGEGVDAGLAVIGKDYNVVWVNGHLINFGVAPKKKCYETFNNLGIVCPDCGVEKIFQENASLDVREYKTINSKGETSWIEMRVTPLKDKKGNVTAALALVIPITERKKAEEQLEENKANIGLINEKLLVVGSLTMHDVGNKLMAAKSNLYLLKKRVGDNAELTSYFDGIESAFAASDRIFEFSRFYERIGSEKPSEENVFDCVNQAVALISNLGTVKVVNECQGLVVVADSLLKQLFYNFVDNSLKHGEKVTQIRLHYTKDDDGVKLFYEDNGVGVSKSNKPKLFDVGFTTGKGSGLGLYLVKKMMDVYGWTITEEGEPDKGAKFTITIPKLHKNGKENYQIHP